MKDCEEIDPLWHLAEALSLQEAASLIACYNPSDLFSCIGDNALRENYPKYLPVIRALEHAVRSKTLKARIIWVPEYDEFNNFLLEPSYETSEINLAETIIAVEDLKKWLTDRGSKEGFFFPNSTPDYLDPVNDHYSPKLAAAIGVWEAISTDPSLMRGTTAKQAMMKWLRRNADKYGLTKDDGSPNEQGIEEVAKIANWDSKGGAPRQ